MATEEKVQNKRIRLDSSLSESGLVLLNRHLPSGIISDIVSRLPLEDIIRCSSVSTDFYQIIKNLHCSNHLHNTKSHVLNILLAKSSPMRFNYESLDYVGINESLHLISGYSKSINGKCKHVEIPHQNELTGRVINSCNGLLCLAYSMGSPYAIYNPITKEKMMLPKLDIHPQCDKRHIWIRSGFGYDLINNKYKVVVAYDYRTYLDDGRHRLHSTGHIITLGESSWRRLQFPKVQGHIDTYQPAVFANGDFHWLNNGMQHDHYEISHKETYQLDGILTLDISTEKFKLTKFLAFLDLGSSRVQLFNIGSSLALVEEKLCYDSDEEDDSDEHDSSDEENSKPPPTKISIWKILRVNADGGYRCQCITLNVDLMRYLKPIGALGNDKFLFEGLKYIPNSKLSYLILYDIENDKGSVLEVPAEVPTFYDATIFQPSLVSPAPLGMY